MGFTEQQALNALRLCGWSVGQAIEYCLLTDAEEVEAEVELPEPVAAVEVSSLEIARASGEAADVDADYALAISLQQELDAQEESVNRAAKVTIGGADRGSPSAWAPANGQSSRPAASGEQSDDDEEDGTYHPTLGSRARATLRKELRQKETVKGVASSGRVEAASRATKQGVFDEATRSIIFKLTNAGLLQEVHGVVKTGKEANVYHALAPTTASGHLLAEPAPAVGSAANPWGRHSADKASAGSPGGSPKSTGVSSVTGVTPAPPTASVAIKVFKTTLNEFGGRAQYVEGDARYRGLKFNKQNRREMFALWADKELRNLHRLRRRGIPAPEPVLRRQHVLVLSFLGKDGWPAPQLREMEMSRERWRDAYAQSVELCRRLYREARLVHGDMSEYNVLVHDRVCYAIDLGQAVDVSHPEALALLRRDLASLGSFIERKGVRPLPPSILEAFATDYTGPSEAKHTVVAATQLRVIPGSRAAASADSSAAGKALLVDDTAAVVLDDAGAVTLPLTGWELLLRLMEENEAGEDASLGMERELSNATTDAAAWSTARAAEQGTAAVAAAVQVEQTASPVA